MNKSAQIFFIASLLLFQGYCSKLIGQQDPQYSQYMFNQLVINPAYAGSKEALSSVIDLRKQWIAMPGAPQTGTFGIHGPMAFKSLGIGGHIIAEAIGPSQWTGAYTDFAYRFRLGKGKLSLGIAAGVVNYNLNLSASDYKDPGETYPSQNMGPKTKFDATAGFYYYTSSFYMGGSITHLTNPNLYYGSMVNAPTLTHKGDTSTINFNLAPHVFLYMGKSWLINDNLVINPSIMYRAVGMIQNIDFNCNFLIKQRVWAGLSLRSGYGMVYLIQYMINDQFRVGYSFDQGFNRIGIYGKSSQEIMLGYNFNIRKSKMVSPRFM